MTLNLGKRRSQRKPAGLLDAVIEHNNQIYEGVIENMGDHGLLALTSSNAPVDTCVPEAALSVRFCSLSGQRIHLGCRIIWVHVNKIPLQGLAYRIGVELLNPSRNYAALVHALRLRYCELTDYYPLNMGWIER